MYYGLGDFTFSTTVQFRPKPGLLSNMGISPFFSPYEKSQIDWWMTQQEGPYSIINKTSDAAGNLYYIVGGQDAKLVNDSLSRIIPQITKYSDMAYTLPQAIKEAASDVGQAAASVAKVAAQSALNIATPVAKAMLPYLIGGMLLVGGAVYIYGQSAKKVRKYVTGG